MMFPHSLYDLKLGFSKSLSLFYSSSLGSLQISVQKLLKEGLIEVHQQATTGRKRTTYRITPAGRTFFLEQLTAPISSARMEETILARYFFLGMAEPPKRLEVLEMLVQTIEAALAELQAVRTSLDQLEIPEEWATAARYRIKTADYGVMSHQNALNWFKEQLKLERKLQKSP